MAEDRQKEEAKQKLRFFKNGKNKAEGDEPSLPGDSTPQAVATEEAPVRKTEAGARPDAAEPAADTEVAGTPAEEPGAGADEPRVKPEGPRAAVEEPQDSMEGHEDSAEEQRSPDDEPRPSGPKAPAGDAPPDAGPRSRRRGIVQPQEPSETDAGESLRSQLLPSVALGFRTLVILAIIIADAFAAYVLTTKVIAPKLIESKIVDLREEIGQLPPEGGMLPAGGSRERQLGQDAVGSMFQIKDIVVNPAGTNGTRYLCTTVTLEISDVLVEEEVEAREAQVRDLLIEILGRRTVPELSSLEMRDYIRDEIRLSVNSLLASGEIDGVYFSNFVLQ